MDYKRLLSSFKEKEMTVSEVAEKIGMSQTGLYSAISRKTLSVEKLEKISEVLQIPIMVFFDGEMELNTYSDAAKKEIAELKKSLITVSEMYEGIYSRVEVYTEKLDELADKARTSKRIIFGVEDYIFNKYPNESKSEKLTRVFDLLTKFKVFEALWPIREEIESETLKTILGWAISDGEIDELKYYVLYQQSLQKDSDSKQDLKVLKQSAKRKAWENFNKDTEK